MTQAPIILLASRSPRRSQLLREAGYPFRVVDAGVDDGQLAPGDVLPAEWTISLAFLKARAARERLNDSDRATGIVLGADTVVVKNDQIIGQPTDADHTRRIIHLLRNGSHEALTGCCLLWPDARRDLFVDRAQVTVGDIPDHEVESYIASGQWRGKAGAYNLFERIQAGWPITYIGDPTTVMGLPMQKLLKRHGISDLRTKTEQTTQ